MPYRHKVLNGMK